MPWRTTTLSGTMSSCPSHAAAWDVHRAIVMVGVSPRPAKAAFRRLVDDVVDQEPYRSARRVF
jgi:hypothetical protein